MVCVHHRPRPVGSPLVSLPRTPQAPGCNVRALFNGRSVSSGNAIRGSRVGAGPMGEAERGESAPRVWVSFWCANRHETRPSFATDAAIPDTWECPRCGNPAGQNEQAPPKTPRLEPYKTHLAYVKERRSDSDGEAILAEALARLRGASA